MILPLSKWILSFRPLQTGITRILIRYIVWVIRLDSRSHFQCGKNALEGIDSDVKKKHLPVVSDFMVLGQKPILNFVENYEFEFEEFKS